MHREKNHNSTGNLYPDYVWTIEQTVFFWTLNNGHVRIISAAELSSLDGQQHKSALTMNPLSQVRSSKLENRSLEVLGSLLKDRKHVRENDLW